MTNSISTKLISAVIAVTASTLSFAEVTHAETLKFDYQQSDLATAAGVAHINERLDKFARNACRNTSPLSTVGQRKQCRKDVASQLRGKIFPAGKREPVK